MPTVPEGLPELSLEEARYAARLVRSVCGSGEWPVCKLLNGDVKVIADQNVERMLVLSAGPAKHWLDSLHVYAETGVLPWGCNGHTIGITRGGPQWRQMLSVLGSGGLVLNAYYVNKAGFLGLGVVVYASISRLRRKLWSDENCESQSPETCYTLRWHTIPLYLPESLVKYVREGNTVEEIREDIVLKVARNSPLNKLIRLRPANCAQSLKIDELDVNEIIGVLGSVNMALLSLARASSREGEAGVEVGEEIEWVERGSASTTSSWFHLQHGIEEHAQKVYSRLRDEGVFLDEEVVRFFVGLVSEGNVLLAGPPGVGKTLLAVTLAEVTGARLISRTMHAGWTRLDLIGGPVLTSSGLRWRSGVLLEAIAEALRGELVLLLLDEVNRCDADRVFGEFFTGFSSPFATEWRPELLLEPVCREARSLGPDETAKMVCERLGEAREAIRERLRIVATLNTVDYASLYSVGEAFTRRFFRIILSPEPESVDKELEAALEAAKRRYNCESFKVDEEARKEFAQALSELRKELQRRGYVTPLPVGPGFVADVVKLAARGCRLTREDVCSMLQAFVSLSTVLDEEVRSAWRRLEERVGCLGEGGGGKS